MFYYLHLANNTHFEIDSTHSTRHIFRLLYKGSILFLIFCIHFLIQTYNTPVFNDTSVAHVWVDL